MVSEAVIVYLKAQAAAGVQAMMIFDTWGGVLSDQAFLDFSLQIPLTMPRNMHQKSLRNSSISLPSFQEHRNEG